MPVTPLGVITGLLIGTATGIVVQRYQYRLQQKQTREEWFQNALGLVSRAERIGRRTTEYQQETNTEVLRSKLGPLSEELAEHAASAPSDVPQGARDELRLLSDIATGLIIISEQDDEMTGTEMLNNLQESVRERGDGPDGDTPDMDLINDIISPMDTDSLAENHPPEDVDFEKEEIEEVLSEVSDETLEAGKIQSLEDVVNFPFEDANELIGDVDIVDKATENVMRGYIRLWLLDITDEIYNDMEDRQSRI